MVALNTAQRVRGEERVLVLGSPTAIAEDALCADLLADAPADEQHVLVLAYNRRPRQVVAEWRETHGDLPAEMAIVHPAGSDAATDALPDGVFATTVNGGDLTGMSIAVSRYLDRWDGDDRSVTACLDSLTTVLQYAEQDRVFRFLHTLTGRIVATGANVHVHLDPATQDEQLVATLSTLFDAVVERDGDGWTVRS